MSIERIVLIVDTNRFAISLVGVTIKLFVSVLTFFRILTEVPSGKPESQGVKEIGFAKSDLASL
ncbi:MAG: hypothetical protein ACKEQK_00485 [Candidatus Hodgkinia cicadicola]